MTSTFSKVILFNILNLLYGGELEVVTAIKSQQMYILCDEKHKKVTFESSSRSCKEMSKGKIISD